MTERGAGGSLASAMIAAALDCVVAMDAEGRITEWNAAAERTFGHRRADVLGRPLAEVIIPPALRQAHRAGLRRYLETGEQVIFDRRLEVTALRADGTEFPVELAVTALPGIHPPQFTGYLRDISQRRQADAARGHLAAIVQTTDDAVESMDLAGFITSWNPGAERMFGYSAAEVVGRHIQFLIPEDRRAEAMRLYETMRAGQALEDFETERVRADGARIAVSLTMSPIFDADGVSGFSVIARDITARKRAEAARELLAAASAALDASLDPDRTVRTIVEMAVPALAELCVIDLVGDGGSIAESAAAAVDPRVARGLEEIRRRYPLDPHGAHPVAQVLRSGEPMVIRDLAEPEVEQQVAQSDEHREFMRHEGYSSAAVVPLVARGRTLGAISLLHVRSDQRYDPGDVTFLMDLAARAAMALDNARLYSERSRVAHTLQRSLLPAALPEPPGLEVAAAYRPVGEGLEVGGDFYDVFEAGSDWVLVVGDVCGKGAEAAALTSLVRHGVRALSLEHGRPSRALELVNAMMLQEERGGRFATALLARLDPSRRPARLRLAAAGHPAAVVVPVTGPPRTVSARGSLLGVEPEATIPEVEHELHEGDVLLLYTDGVLDAGAPARVLSEEGLCAALARGPRGDAEAVARHTVDLALELSCGSLRDDVAVLAVRLR